MTGRPHACFGMYPFEPIRPAWERLVSALHDRLAWVPAELDWSENVHDAWRDEDCVLSHACGWPVAALLAGEVRVIGAFSLTLPGSVGHRYRSVLLARRAGRPGDFATQGTVAIANSPDSLSGWVSLVTATVGVGGRWPGEVVWSGAHAESLSRLRAGEADLACIDGWTFAHLLRIDPSAADGLFEIGRGPWIPSPAVVVRTDTEPARVDAARAAFEAVLADPGLAADRAALMVDGFVRLDDRDYASLVELAPAR